VVAFDGSRLFGFGVFAHLAQRVLLSRASGRTTLLYHIYTQSSSIANDFQRLARNSHLYMIFPSGKVLYERHKLGREPP